MIQASGSGTSRCLVHDWVHQITMNANYPDALTGVEETGMHTQDAMAEFADFFDRLCQGRDDTADLRMPSVC